MTYFGILLGVLAMAWVVRGLFLLEQIRDHLKTIADSLDLPEEWKKNAGPPPSAYGRNVQSQPNVGMKGRP